MNFQDLIAYKSFDTLRTEAFDALKALNSKITNLNIGGRFRTLLELSIQGTADLYDLLLEVIPKGYVQTATSSWLDYKAAELGLERHLASKTRGEVTFLREGTSGNVVISEGTIIATDTDQNGQKLQYITTAQVILTEGNSEVCASVEAEEEGSQYNIGSGYIVNLVTPIAGIAVTNNEDWITTPGTDEEEDDALRLRCLSRWNALARGATREAYRQWALEIPGVNQVAVDDQFPRGQGTVDVIITGSGGAPGAELISEVQSLLDERKPICSDVLVKGPSEVAVDIDVTIYKHPLYGNPDTIETEATTIINALFILNSETEVTPLQIGDNVVRARIIKELMIIENVIDIMVTSPADNISIESDQIAVLNSLSITIENVEL